MAEERYENDILLAHEFYLLYVREQGFAQITCLSLVLAEEGRTGGERGVQNLSQAFAKR